MKENDNVESMKWEIMKIMCNNENEENEIMNNDGNEM